ncbi:hypothetical protein [Listeria sp. PSOL-1]|uniref:hypothetical protein n=1 Tax=Listeria sp. PSOL-1 TaxID=1844999 RepID=UPI0013D46B6A|nr:hypothetical protein [Listeria sp. PSOL-1]
MEKMVLKSHSYKKFSLKFSNVFDEKNELPEKVFNESFHRFYVYDMDYFYNDTGWGWLLDISSENNEKILYFTSQVKENDDFQVVYIPNVLTPETILKQIDVLEYKTQDKKNTFFLTFNEACLFSTTYNWGLYFVNEFNFVILGVKDNFKVPSSFVNIKSMSLKEFHDHFQEWSAWKAKDDKRYLNEFDNVYF